MSFFVHTSLCVCVCVFSFVSLSRCVGAGVDVSSPLLGFTFFCFAFLVFFALSALVIRACALFHHRFSFTCPPPPPPAAAAAALLVLCFDCVLFVPRGLCLWLVRVRVFVSPH